MNFAQCSKFQTFLISLSVEPEIDFKNLGTKTGSLIFLWGLFFDIDPTGFGVPSFQKTILGSVKTEWYDLSFQTKPHSAGRLHLAQNFLGGENI